MNKEKLQKQLEDKDWNGNNYILINDYFKCQWINPPIKRYTVAEWIKNKNLKYAASKRLTSG